MIIAASVPALGAGDRSQVGLTRFVEAQASTYSTALLEIRRGRKRTHWMWYVFPQIAGLGQSDRAKIYAIANLAEARAYLAHPILGPRLQKCVAALQDLAGNDAEQVFGTVDAAKLRSSLTLFVAAEGGSIFDAALRRWFGDPDALTLEILAGQQLQS